MAKSLKPAKSIKRTDSRTVPVGGKPTGPVKGAKNSTGKLTRGGG